MPPSAPATGPSPRPTADRLVGAPMRGRRSRTRAVAGLAPPHVPRRPRRALEGRTTWRPQRNRDLPSPAVPVEPGQAANAFGLLKRTAQAPLPRSEGDPTPGPAD